MDQLTETAFTKLATSFGDTPVGRYLTFIGDLYQAPPFTALAVDKTIEKDLRRLHLNEAADFFLQIQDTFDPTGDWLDIKKNLTLLISSIDEPRTGWQNSVGGVLLVRQAAANWLAAAKYIANDLPPNLEVTLGWPLSSQQQIYHYNLGQQYYYELPLVILNNGNSIAKSIQIIISVEKGNAKFRSNTIQLSSPIIPGECYLEVINTTYTQDSQVKVTILYEGKQTKSDGSTTATFELPIPTMASQDHRLPYLDNPYLPGRPLLTSTERILFSQSDQPSILNKIFNANDLPAGLIVLWGLRQTGKTTLTYHLRQKLAQMVNAPLVVYIDLHSWYIALTSNNITLSKEELWRELAYAVIRAAEINRLDDKIIAQLEKKYISQYQPVSEYRFIDFQSLIFEFYQKLNKSIVFLLDEFQAALQDVDPYSINAWRMSLPILHYLTLTYEGNAFKFILTDSDKHLVPTNKWGKWEDILNDLRINENAMHLHIRFLTQRDVFKMANLIKINTKTKLLSADTPFYIWQLTGGWQGLLQVILYKIVVEVNERIEQGNTSILVTKELIDSALSQISHNEVIQFLHSFNEFEKRFLRALHENPNYWLVSPKCILKGLYFSKKRGLLIDQTTKRDLDELDTNLQALKSLLDKQIIEPTLPSGANSRLYLRVRFLTYATFWQKNKNINNKQPSNDNYVGYEQ